MRLKKFLNENIILKNHNGKEFKTNIEPSKRTLKNIPKYSTGKTKCKFQDWLGLKGSSDSGPQGYDGKYYGWSHRAVYGFTIGDKITKDTIGNIKPNTEWIIKTEEEAKKQAISFAKEIA